MSLRKNEYGLFVKARSYGRSSYDELAAELGLRSGETLYDLSQNTEGVRTSRPVSPREKWVRHKPGTRFVAGPTITKAAVSSEHELPVEMRRQMETLRASGLGSVQDPVPLSGGWGIHLKGLILSGGVRTDALILLPKDYPLVSPIGFYVRRGANVGGLDTSHLFHSRSYHNAPDLTQDGWSWYCGVAENWKPGRHDLLGYLAAVLALFNERSK